MSDLASSTWTPPFLQPTASSPPSGEYPTHRALLPSATARCSLRDAAHHTCTCSPSDAVANSVGAAGFHATPYRSPEWPCISTRGVSSISHTSDLCVPATNTSLPGAQSRPRNTGGFGVSLPERRFTGVAPSTEPSLRSPEETSHEMTWPSAPAESSVFWSARRRRHRTPWCVGGPSSRVTCGPAACALTTRTHFLSRESQTAMAPSGVPVTHRPDGSHAADITACFFAAGANLPDSSAYVLLPSGLLHHLMWFTP
mmetsp:Transcript_10889/g.42428  ORF Transcript_10889/g.42428 Transcript_10889/m.42428 type:complete len:256 (-) Transcript_10889:1354-2121(-)